MKRLSAGVDIDYQSLKFSAYHLPGVTANDTVTNRRRSNVRSGDDLSLAPVPGQCPRAGGVSLRVAATRPGRGVAPARKVVPDEGLSVLGALVSRTAIRSMREQQQRTQNKQASQSHNLFLQGPLGNLFSSRSPTR